MAEEQRQLHIYTEFMAIFLLVPYLIYLLYKYSLSLVDRIIISVIILLTALVDGYLLFTW